MVNRRWNVLGVGHILLLRSSKSNLVYNVRVLSDCEKNFAFRDQFQRNCLVSKFAMQKCRKVTFASYPASADWHVTFQTRAF